LTPPAAPTLTLAFGVKELRFSWDAVDGADFYRLFEDPDGVSGYGQVGGDLTALRFNHTISVHRRVNASYTVRACNSAGCTASAAQVLGANLTQAIGYMKASNTGSLDQFGVSIALSGDGNTLAVGARNEDSSTAGVNGTPDEGAADSGAVYVFTRGAGVWSQQAFVKASNTEAGDLFGISIALSADGDTLAVGAPLESSGAIFSGAAYVFTRSAGVWSQQGFVKASNAGAGDNFGTAVALSGDGNTLAVGAVVEDSSATGVNGTPDNGTPDSGAVYVFTRSAGVWSQQAFVKASNTGMGDEFGVSVALSGDGNTLAVGAIFEDSSTVGVNGTPDEGAADSGAVYVFTRSAGVWSQQAFVKASNTGAGDGFGFSVALSGDGDTLAVGAPQEDSSTTGVNSTPNEGAASSGAVYVFTRGAGVWSQQAYVKASKSRTNDQFGHSVALSGDGSTLVVGAPLEPSSTTGVNSTPDELATSSGAAYVFSRSAGVWSQQAYIKAPNTGAIDLFGWSVAVSGDGDTVAVGAIDEDSSTTGVGSTPNESAADSGAAYLY